VSDKITSIQVKLYEAKILEEKLRQPRKRLLRCEHEEQEREREEKDSGF
jgi:hypothetical protein